MIENNLHNIEKIENINIFQNINDPKYNSCVIIFRDRENVPFLFYIEKMDSSLILNEKSIEVSYMHIPLKKDFSFECDIRPVDGVIMRIIDLSFKPEEKELTKEEIEKKLGYKIKII